ncbi:hypothetical protein [Capnocytophaga leadbetteri]|uniref:hypothetical protein n=1 Tax=Capnocytophaga leadbetteri TaxID=327575 RepID=UPI0028D39819|nr:hypothetical protein [Capnocytophaga leadbetteri]
MKETLEQELVDLATEIIAYQGRLNLSELSQKAHKISEKITILGFVEKYYQMLRTSEQRMTYTLRKVANFIDEQENIFNIDVAFKELQPLEQPLIEETPAEKPAFVAMEPAPVQAAAEPIAEKVAEPTPEPTPEQAPAEPVHFATPPAEPTPAAEPVPAEPIHFTTPPAEPTPAAEPATAEPIHFATPPAEPTPAAEPAPAEPIHFATPPAEPTPAAEPAPAEPIHFATPPVETAPAPAEVVAEPAPAEVPDTTTDSVVEMTQFASPEATITEPAAAQPVTNTSDEDLTSLYQDWNDWHSYTLPDDPPAEVAAPVSAPVATPAPAATPASEVVPTQTTVAAPVQAAPVARAATQPVENITPPTTINTQQPLREASTPDWAVSIEQPIVPPRPQQAETVHEPIHAAAPEQAPTSVVEQVLTAERLHPHQAAQPTAVPEQAPVAQPVQSAQPENFIQQQHLTEEQQILRQTPSLEEFLAKSKATAFDKKDHTEEVKPTQSLNDRFSKEIQIGLNDKLAFIQKLFFGSESEYNRVLQHLNQLHSLEEAAQYIQQQVKPTYNNWKGKEEYEERFLHLILRRFE